MSAGVIAFIFGLGISAWLFNYMTKTSSVTRSILVICGVVGLVSFFVLFTILNYLVK
jgi:hypothetical protein